MKNSKIIVTFLGIALAGAILYGVYVGINILAMPYQNNQSLGGDFSASQRYYLSAGTGSVAESGESSATTTEVFMLTSATASSTIVGRLDRGDQINLFLRATASSSLSVLNWAVDVSDNYIDWYPLDAATTTTDIANVINVGDARTIWSLATSTDSNCGANSVCKHVPIAQNVYGGYFRIRFGITGSNAAVHGYAHVREGVPR